MTKKKPPLPFRPKKAKPVPYRLIAAQSEAGAPIYRMLTELLEQHHQDVVDARFALAFHLSWQPDADGRLMLGQCRKVSDLDREVLDLAAFDFIILLNQNFWEDELVNDVQRRALLDHELCHATVARDLAGEPIVDERQRTVYRIRKHDLEEFGVIAERYGCWKADIEQFASSLAKARGVHLWIGFSGLQTQLVAVGVPVKLEAIAMWSEAERKEAAVWAALQRDSPAGASVAFPAHVSAVLYPPS